MNKKAAIAAASVFAGNADMAGKRFRTMNNTSHHSFPAAA
jgi:hypothetical protein